MIVCEIVVSMMRRQVSEMKKRGQRCTIFGCVRYQSSKPTGYDWGGKEIITREIEMDTHMNEWLWSEVGRI
jgi:hypothetical protein